RAELERVDRRGLRPQPCHLLARAERQRLARTYRCAPRLQADRRAVVAHVALHHQVHPRLHLRHAERTREHAVVAGNAPRLARGLHHAVLGALDGIGRTDLGARWRIAVHAHDGCRLCGVRTVHVVELDHRLALVRIALRARLDARLTADTSAGIDEELEGRGHGHDGSPGYCCGSSAAAWSGGPAAFRTRTAHTLYSGI